jgi:hypothetical protein
MSNDLVAAIKIQSEGCEMLGARFSAGILDNARKDLEAGGVISRLLAQWEDVPRTQLVRDAVALRFLASLHFLVLNGQAPDLAACYPPQAFDPDRAWAVARSMLGAFPEQMASMLAHEPQTNEVRRSACLLGGFLTIGHETKLPLRCFELGASAGLNSLWDKFRYEIGGQVWGDKDSPVILSCDWQGAAPGLEGGLTVVERQACDRRPIDVRRTEDAIRLLSYCWAEQSERMERLRAAVALAQDFPVAVDEAQASHWVVQAGPTKGTATIVFHSIVWQYIPSAEQAEIFATLQEHAARATANAPFFWLRMELNEASRQFELLLWSWQTRKDRLLAVVHPHGEFARWC